MPRGSVIDSRSGLLINDYMVKTAGEIDYASLKRVSKNVRPGDLVSFIPHAADMPSVSSILGTKLISDPIRKVTKSDVSHVALVESVDPKTGRVRIIHNHELGNVKGLGYAYLDDFAENTSFKFHRPKGVSANTQKEAIKHIKNALPYSNFSKRKILMMAPQELIRGRLGMNSIAGNLASHATGVVAALNDTIEQAVSKKKGRHVKCVNGVCSTVPLYGYAKSIQKKGESMASAERRAAELLNAEVAYAGSTTFSPKSLATSKSMEQVTDMYTPLNKNRSSLKQVFRLGRKALRRAVLKR
jgi:hypothetical protein